jgi:hypothetical protein
MSVFIRHFETDCGNTDVIAALDLQSAETAAILTRVAYVLMSNPACNT